MVKKLKSVGLSVIRIIAIMMIGQLILVSAKNYSSASEKQSKRRKADGSPITKLQKLPNLPAFGDLQEKKKRIYLPIVIVGDERRPFCSGTVIDNNYVLTAAHCVVEETQEMTSKDLYVSNNTLEAKPIKAKAAAVNILEDYAIIMGDFSEFKPMAVDFYNSFDLAHSNPVLVSCGFPDGQVPETCVRLSDVTPYSTGFIAYGSTGRGMSGGPVAIVIAGRGSVLVGVNSAVDGGLIESGIHANVLFSSIVGLLGAFDLQRGNH